MLLKGNKLFRSVTVGALVLLTAFGISLPVGAENDAPSAEQRTEIIIPVNKDAQSGTVAEYDFTVNEASAYELEFRFYSIGRDDPTVSVEIDGKNPFPSDRVELPNNWKDAANPRKDERGNEIAPEQVLSDELVKYTAADVSGQYELPYNTELAAGLHRVKLTVHSGSFKLDSLVFRTPERLLSYEEWSRANKVSGKTDSKIVLEGEKAVLKSSRSIISLSDTASPALHPSNPITKKLNYIGGANWSDVGDTVSWSFDCEKAGYYSLGFNYRQNTIINGVSYRHLKVDGATPFEEARRIKFQYGSSWQYMSYGKEKPYYIYLDKGPHTISLTATAGEISEVYAGLKDVVEKLGDMYLDITVIVGETVDNNRSYELFKQIPDLEERLRESIKSLDDIIKLIERIQNKNNGSLVSNFISAKEILNQMLEHPYTAHRYKSAYYTAYTNLSASLGTLTDMPLDIDRITLIGNGQSTDSDKASFFSKIGFSAKRFLYTFSQGYNSYKKEDKKDITLWVNWGRDQAQVLKALVQESFTEKTGINVNIKVTNSTIIQGILAGKGPDLMLHMSRAEPVNLAMRGALVELSKFDDYDEVIKRFNKGAVVPYTYKGDTYALPDTQNFYLMFIRKDITDEFGIEIPKTWDEFLEAATVLQRSNLQVSLPYTQITDSGIVNVGVGGLTLYPTLLLQNGLSIYNEDLTASTLTEADRLKIFTDWTQWYTDYKIPSVMDFYNRFRIGSAPIGIAGYTLVTQLKAAAPEINGKWIVAEIPGVKAEDGSINNISAGSGSACAITKLSDNPEAAWEFLKWWTSAEAQVSYSNNLESYIGPLGRVATSNLEAFDQIGWDAELLPTMKAQLTKISEIPEIPGGYYSARGIDQAFWNVLEQSKNPKDMLVEWGEIVNNEIQRKRKEYGG